MDSYLKIAIICFSVSIIIVILGILGHISSAKGKKKEAAEMQSKGIKNRLYSVKHVYGLPCPEDTRVTIEAYKDRISFSANNVNYDLPYGRINDVCMKTDFEIRTQTTSSAGGAVAGAMLFGPLGAAIGGRTKSTNYFDAKDYLIFTYTDKTGKIAYMGFQISMKKDAKLFIEAVRPRLPKAPANVEL